MTSTRAATLVPPICCCSWKLTASVVRNLRRVGLFSEQKVVPLNFHFLVFLLVKGEKL